MKTVFTLIVGVSFACLASGASYAQAGGDSTRVRSGGSHAKIKARLATLEADLADLKEEASQGNRLVVNGARFKLGGYFNS